MLSKLFIDQKEWLQKMIRILSLAINDVAFLPTISLSALIYHSTCNLALTLLIFSAFVQNKDKLLLLIHYTLVSYIGIHRRAIFSL